jgi:hypothetical protein
MSDLTPDVLVRLYETAGPKGDPPPLEGLATVDWSAVNDCYGPATDVPALLRALVSDNPEHREFACLLLCSTLWHQGDVFEATPLAVPFLYNLLEAEGPYDKELVACVLSNIADGHPPISTRCEGDSKEAAMWRGIFTKDGKDLEREFEKERRFMAELRKQLDERAYLLAPYLLRDKPDGGDGG